MPEEPKIDPEQGARNVTTSNLQRSRLTSYSYGRILPSQVAMLLRSFNARIARRRLSGNTVPKEPTKMAEEKKEEQEVNDDQNKFLLHNVFKNEALKEKKDLEEKGVKEEFAMEVLISTITEELNDVLL